MRKYAVGFWYEQGGRVIVEANNRAQATRKVFKQLDEEGLEGMKYESLHRDYNTTGVEVVK